jgi:hypothetical protein
MSDAQQAARQHAGEIIAELRQQRNALLAIVERLIALHDARGVDYCNGRENCHEFQKLMRDADKAVAAIRAQG